jgi:hypothetical protein
MAQPRVERSFSEPNIRLTCRCGWEGHDVDIKDWVIDTEHDRTVRRCPSCGEAVPEWGAIQPVEGAAAIAHGPLADAIAETDALKE